jgi:hypothetical protein
MVQVARVDRFKRQIDFRAALIKDKELEKRPGKPFKGRRICAGKKVQKNLVKKRTSSKVSNKPTAKGKRRNNSKTNYSDR